MYEQSDLALIGSRIKAVRTGKGMSQADLAVKASVSLPLISNIERGKTRMQLETFVKVAEALQVSADHLLRADVPEVKTIYQGEFAELLEDCSASEMETILNIVREVKASMHKKQNMDWLSGWLTNPIIFFHLHTIGQDVDLWYLLIFKRFPYNSSKRADPNTGGKHGKHGAAAIRHRTRTRRG